MGTHAPRRPERLLLERIQTNETSRAVVEIRHARQLSIRHELLGWIHDRMSGHRAGYTRLSSVDESRHDGRFFQQRVSTKTLDLDDGRNAYAGDRGRVESRDGQLCDVDQRL